MANSGQSAVEEDLRIAIGDWIVSQALAGATEVEILTGVCERLNRAGQRIWRASVAHNLLDPTFDARGVRWVRTEGGQEEEFQRSEDPSAGGGSGCTAPSTSCSRASSPHFGGTPVQPIPEASSRCSIGSRMRELTDYVAFAARVDESVRLGEGEGIAASWTTDAPEGFSDAQVELLAGIMPPLTLFFMVRTMHRDGTHADRDVSRQRCRGRVLAGAIVRGSAEPIRAVFWFSDLVGFTRLSDTASPDIVLDS